MQRNVRASFFRTHRRFGVGAGGAEGDAKLRGRNQPDAISRPRARFAARILGIRRDAEKRGKIETRWEF